MLGYAGAVRAQQKKEGAIPLDTVTVEGQAKQAAKPKGKKAAAKKAPTQPVPAPAPELIDDDGCGESVRVVSSGKRDEDPLNVPAGIDVATPADLTPRNFTNITDLDRVFIDTNIRQRSSRAYANITVRGQSSVDFYNASVGIYIDGLPQDQTTFGELLPLGLDHVELLYGPQGTLYGRNSVGGVLEW